MGNWRHTAHLPEGWVTRYSATLADLDEQYPDFFPDLRCGRSVLVGSDYSGQNDAPRLVYSFLFCAGEATLEWQDLTQQVRRDFLVDNREMAFKKLGGDKVRQRALPHFLAAADRLPGILLTVVVDKSIGELFARDDPQMPPELAKTLATWKPELLDQALAVVHFIAATLAGSTAPGQSVIWTTDRDAIVEPEARMEAVTDLLLHTIGGYSPHSLDELRFCTNEEVDDERRLLDYLSIPDLAAGAVADLIEGMAADELLPELNQINPLPELRDRVEPIIDWLNTIRGPLRKLICYVEADPETDETVWRYMIVAPMAPPATEENK